MTGNIYSKQQKNIKYTHLDNNWLYGESIKILSSIAALLHDLGKSTVGFQQKLIKKSFKGDPYRHEWISLQLFLLMVNGCNSNKDCLDRLSNFSQYINKNPEWYLSLSISDKSNLNNFPPIVQFIGWLIVTHHRMPFDKIYNSKEFKGARNNEWNTIRYELNDFYARVRANNYWLKNDNDDKDFFIIKEDVTTSNNWQKELSHWSNKALSNIMLMSLSKNIISNPFLFYLCRLSLMLGDHNYSSLKKESIERVNSDSKITLIANTDNGDENQKLDEHLIGVSQLTSNFANILPTLNNNLPTIKNHNPFSKHTEIERFVWQNKSYDLAKQHQKKSQEQGFFGVNMASTGRGKTLSNARIMYALADEEKGVRFTIALGLRTLTLQTGLALKDKLELDDSQLAILIGGQKNTKKTNSEEIKTQFGSDSSDDIVDGLVFPPIEKYPVSKELGVLVANEKSKQLIYNPIVVCTIDHLMGSSESDRSGKQIIPILRLLTSDLILDEPDDFSQEDLPALSRLVYLAGLFGTKILLSSATLTPDLISGLFDAYNNGRAIWQEQNNLENNGIVCAWFDEYNQNYSICNDKNFFEKEHEKFVTKRSQKLQEQEPKHIAKILNLNLKEKIEGQDIDYHSFANQLLTESYELHKNHCETFEYNNNSSNVSVGLIRFANIEQLIKVLQYMYKQDNLPTDTTFHLCCYHARQLLILRSSLENKLDRILNRNDLDNLYKQHEIINAIKESNSKNNIFIVLATPVAEVGRDHSYSWAIIEPSSMRSIIQLAGRVWRHEPTRLSKLPNISILNSNISSFKYGNLLGVGDVTFSYPGFEEKDFLLDNHDINYLIPSWQLKNINSVARIQKPKKLEPKKTLVDLEHAVIANLLNPNKNNFVNSFYKQELSHHAHMHLHKISPFRYNDKEKISYVCQPDNLLENKWKFSFKTTEKALENPDLTNIDTENKYICYKYKDEMNNNNQVKVWLEQNLSFELNELSNKLDQSNLNILALEYSTIELEKENSWYFNQYLGFWRKDI